MLTRIFLIFFHLSCLYGPAQTDSTKTDSVNALNEVVITGFQTNNAKFTSLNIEAYSLEKLNEKTPFNLSDTLSKVPGVSQMSTGNSISKPVIRGLYGNRILVLLSGARFDNRQWQDEHGLRLSQIGIDRVESIFSETLSGSNGDNYTKDITITTRNIAGTEKYTFTVVNRDGLRNSVSLTLTVQ